MIYSSTIDEKGKTSSSSLEFNSGKKIELDAKEAIEFDNKLREIKAQGKLKEKERIIGNVLPALQIALDMARKNEYDLHLSFGVEMNTTSTYYINTISGLTGYDPSKIMKMSEERIK